MSLLSTLTSLSGVAGKALDRLLPDRAESRRQQAELSREELVGAPVSRLRLWRSFLGWALSLCLFWEVALRPLILTYWPAAVLPPSMLEEVEGLLLGMLGLGF